MVLGNRAGVTATFALSDTLRADALHASEQLRELGLKMAIASGDQEHVGHDVARQLGIEEAAARLTPADKLAYVQQCQVSGAHV